MPRKHITINSATAYSYELWAGKNTSLVHAITSDKELLSIVLPTRQVEAIAAEIDAGRQPIITISAVVYSSADEARGEVARS